MNQHRNGSSKRCCLVSPFNHCVGNKHSVPDQVDLNRGMGDGGGRVCASVSFCGKDNTQIMRCHDNTVSRSAPQHTAQLAAA
jgi:hypothetical protein